MASLRIGARTPKGIYKTIVLDVGRQVKIGIGYVDGKPIEHAYFNTLEEIENCVIQGREPGRALWKRIGRLPTKIRKKLVDHRLICEPDSGPTLATVAKQFLDDKLKAGDPRTVRNYRSALEKGILTFLDRDRKIETVSADDLLEFIQRSSEVYADSTVKNQIKRAKSLFEFAVDLEYIPANPFKTKRVRELSKMYSVELSTERKDTQIELLTEDAIAKLLGCKKSERSEIEDKEWNALIHLLRFGGGRVSSYLVLRWDDINFEDKGITLRMKLTGNGKKYERGKKRVEYVPLFREIEQPLRDLRSLQPKGTKYVLNKIGNLEAKPEFETTNAKGERIQQGRWETNLSTTFKKILKRNGIVAWSQTLHAFRAYRSAELDRLGASDTELNAWIGNSPEVRKRFYGKFSRASKERVAKLSGRNG